MRLRFVLNYEGYSEYEIVTPAGPAGRVRYQRARPSDYFIGVYNEGVWPDQVPATGTVSHAHHVGELPSPALVDALHALLLADHAKYRAAAEDLDWPLTAAQREPPTRPRPVRFDRALCCWVDEHGARAHYA